MRTNSFRLLLLVFLPFMPILALTGLHHRLVRTVRDSGIPGRGRTDGLIVVVKPGIPWEESTIAHEYVHVRQAWMLFLVGHYLLKYIPAYQKWCETQAYAESVKHGRSLDDASAALMQYGYRTQADAEQALIKINP